MPLLALFLSACPFDIPYHVYYDGSGHTAGFPPWDSKTYFAGDTAAALEKPEDLKKGVLEFLGWRRYNSDTLIKPGDLISIDHDDVWLYAWWSDDPNKPPYEYAEDPQREGGAIITKFFSYNSYGLSISVPGELGGRPVTAIGEGAFFGAALSGLTLPGTLERIGNKAFAGNWLQSISIPDAVTEIGKLAFQNCELETVNLGSGLKSIGDYAFDGNQVTALFLPGGFKTLGEGAFYGSGLVSIEIGDGVDIKSGASLGTWGAKFREYYAGEGKDSKGGVYIYSSGAWKGPYRELASPTE
jgi:hypothetical protein